MEQLTKNYAIHLDNLRIKYKVTEESLVEGICSSRHYRRYLSGERTLPINRIIEFCNKLGISEVEFFYTYSANDELEFAGLYRLYGMLAYYDYDKIFMEYKKIDKSRFINTQNIKFLDAIYEITRHFSKRAHPHETLDCLSKIIDYPNCLKRDIYDFVDVLVLTVIAEIETDFSKDMALNRLLEILKNNKLMNLAFGSRKMLPSIYANTSVYLTKLKQYDKSLDISTKGITYSLKYNDISAMTKIRYVKAFSLLKLGYIEQAEIEVIKCFNTLIALDNKVQTKLYHDLIQKDFGIDPIDIMVRYKKEFF